MADAMQILGFLFALLSLLAVGFGICSLLRFPLRRSFFGTFGLIFGIGAGALPLLAFWAAMLGIRLSFFVMALMTLPFWLLSVRALRRPRQEERRTPGPPVREFHGLKVLGWLWLLALILIVSVNTLKKLPMGDGVNFWAMKSRILYEEGTMLCDDFYDECRLHPHRDYPLGIPLLKTWFLFSMGEGNDSLGRVVYPLFFIALAFLFFGHLRRAAGPLGAVLCTVLFCSMVRLVGHLPGSISSGYSDFPLAFFFAAAALYLAYWISSGMGRHLAVSALFTTFACHTKNEGAPFVLILMGAAFLFGIARHGRKGAFAAFLFCLWTGAAAIPWFLFAVGVPTSEENYLARLSLGTILENRHRLFPILNFFFREFIKIHLWGFVWVFFWTVLLLDFPRILRNRIFPVLLILAGQAGVYLLIYIIGPGEEFFYTTGARLLLHLSPMAFLVAVHGALEIQADWFKSEAAAGRKERKRAAEETS
jgi:hypothetical protein